MSFVYLHLLRDLFWTENANYTDKGKAFELFRKMTDFRDSFTGISRAEDRTLFRIAANMISVDEFEKDANISNDEPKKKFIQEQRSARLMSIETYVDRLHWADNGSTIYPLGIFAQNAIRYTMSFMGGFALLVPMTIMVLHPGRFTALVTTIVSVFGIALILSMPTPLRQVGPSDAFTGVALYSAVLVVFVGASTTSDTSGIDERDKDVAGGLIGGIFVLLVFILVLCLMSLRSYYLELMSRDGRTGRQTEDV